MLDRHEDLHNAEQDLDQDQEHDVPLQPQAAAALQYFQHGLGSPRNEVQLPLQRQVPFANLKLVFQPQIEPFQIGMLPDNLRLVDHLHAADQIMFAEQRYANLL